MSKETQKNVFGEPLEPCSNEPLTVGLEMDVAILTKMIVEFILCVQKLLVNF